MSHASGVPDMLKRNWNNIPDLLIGMSMQIGKSNRSFYYCMLQK